MIAEAYLKANENKLNRIQLRFAKTLITRNRDKPETHEEIADYLKIMVCGYAAPWLAGIPEIVELTPAAAKRILRHTRLWPRIRRPDQSKIAEFAALMKTEQWQLDTKQPIMISQSGALLNGRHRLRAIIKSGTAVRMPVIDKYGVTKTIIK